MDARPETALALATVPHMHACMMEEDLYQLLGGVVAVLNEHDCLTRGRSFRGRGRAEPRSHRHRVTCRRRRA